MKKKIRYSEFATPMTPTPTRFTPASSGVVCPVVPAAIGPTAGEVPAAPAGPAAPPAVIQSAAQAPPEPLAEPTAAMPEVAPVRTRRNSAPIDLARALAAARSAEARQEAGILAAVNARTAAARASRLTPPVPQPAVPADLAEPTPLPPEPEQAESQWENAAPVPRAPRRPLRDRARSRAGTAELLMFRVGSERFAVELVCVEEAIDLPEVHHVPEMPPAMLGVITVRGVLTPVYRPDSSLGVPVAGKGAALIFRVERGRFALAIDDVDDVLTLDLAMLRDAPGVEGADSVVLGVARNGGLLVALVDSEALVLACQAIPALELV
jgi:purine-binding chemotaxis protein CheW